MFQKSAFKPTKIRAKEIQLFMKKQGGGGNENKTKEKKEGKN